MDHPKFIVSKLKEESISIQRVKETLIRKVPLLLFFLEGGGGVAICYNNCGFIGFSKITQQWEI